MRIRFETPEEPKPDEGDGEGDGGDKPAGQRKKRSTLSAFYFLSS